MELKVWVEGIQRVICGVTESTTCQDVVIALAHATGKTGRFTLVERWRDNERLLAPTEPPLRVLHKWGEYACDVQFILRHSDKDRKRSAAAAAHGAAGHHGDGLSSHGQSRSLDHGGKRTEKFLHNFTPHGGFGGGNGGGGGGSVGSHNPQRRSSASSIRKSLTFSGAHTFFPPVKSSPSSVTPTAVNNNNNVSKPLMNNASKQALANGPHSGSGHNVRHSETSSMESLDEQLSSASYSSSSSPYASLEKQQRKQHHNAALHGRTSLGPGSYNGGGMSREQQQQGMLPGSAVAGGGSSGGGGGALRPSPRRSPRPEQRLQSHSPQQTSPLPPHIIPPQHHHHQQQQQQLTSMLYSTSPSNTSTPRSSPYRDNTNSKSDVLHTIAANNNNNIAKVTATQQQHQHQQHPPLQPLQQSHMHNANINKPIVNQHTVPSPAKQHPPDYNNLDQSRNQALLPSTQQQQPQPSSSPSIPPQHQKQQQPTTTKVNGTLQAEVERGGDQQPQQPSPRPLSPSSGKKDELLRLVKLQQERLGVQDSQLKILDSEIQYWEGREEDFNEQCCTVRDETTRLTETERSLDDALQELDLVSWVDKLEIEKQHKKMLQSELTLVRSQIANAESELLAAKTKMTGVSAALEEERRRAVVAEQENKENEIKMLQEIAELQKQVNRKLLAHEQNTGSLEQLASEVKSLESTILEKKTQIADWERELRTVNLDLFAQTPSTDWLKAPGSSVGPTRGAGSGDNLHQGKEKGFGRLSPSRPGSSRKIHNPQRLKETVATTKNPHGMWV